MPTISRVAPSWLTRGIVYQIWLRSFTAEGTLAAATRRLGEVAHLGATMVYLNPLMLADDDQRRRYWSTRQKASANCNPRNPYRAKDYDVIDPEYGTEADLCRFVAAAHGLGLRVIMDMVFLHTGPTCTLTSNPEFYQRDAQGQLKLGWWNFPLLNFESRGLREYLIENMSHWLRDCNVDGFRCDVSFQIPLDFWEEARPRLEAIRSDLAMIAESCHNPQEQVQAFDLSYGFRWYEALRQVFCGDKPASHLREQWEFDRNEYSQGARFLRYNDNHDLHRADVVFGERGCQAAAMVNLALDGVPMLYNGQEIGDATPQDLFSHWPIRWEAADLPLQSERRRWYQRLCELRRTHPALTQGRTQWLDHDQPQIVSAFARQHDLQTLLCVVNASNRPVTVTLSLPSDLQGGAWRSLLDESTTVAKSNGDVTLALKSFEGYLGLRS